MLIRFFLVVCLSFSCAATVCADQTTQEVNLWRQSHEQQIIDRFAALLSIPNVASDTTNIRKNAEHISQLLTDVGMNVELLELQGSNPVVFAERVE